MSDPDGAVRGLLERLREQLNETFDDDAVAAGVKERLSRALAGGILSLPQGVTFEEFAELVSPEKHSSGTQDRLDRLWSQIRKTVQLREFGGEKSEVRDRLDRTQIASLRTKLFSAYTMRAGEGYLVIYDLAMHDLMYTLIKLALSCWDVVSEDDTDENKHPELRTSPAVAARVARIMISHYKWEGYLWTPVSVNLPERAWDLAVGIVEAAESFILAHEAAHILLGDLEEDKVKRVAVVGIDVESENCRAEREVLADCLAFKLTIDPEAKTDIDENEFFVRALGAFTFFQAADLYEKAYFLRPPGTHPDPLARFQTMWELVMKDIVGDSRSQHLFGFLKIISKLCDDVRKRPARKELDIPLSDLVNSSPLLDFDLPLAEDDLAMMRNLEQLDYYIGLPAMNHLASIARAAYGNEIVDNTASWFRRATIRALEELAESSPEMAAAIADPDAIKFYELAAIGSQWLMKQFPQKFSIDGCLALFSPSPGKPYSIWRRELADAIGDEYAIPLLGMAHINRSGRLGYFPMSVGYEWVTDIYVDEFMQQRLSGDQSKNEESILLRSIRLAQIRQL